MSPRIVGGTEAPKGRYPYMAMMTSSGGSVACGASLVAPDIVLSAAYCDGFVTEAQVGRHDLTDPSEEYETFALAETIVHPSWDSGTYAFNFLIGKLDGPSKFAPVRLNGEDKVPAATGDALTAMGYGVTVPGGSAGNDLYEASMKYITNEACEEIYVGRTIGDDMMCSFESGKDACAGDGGGPLIVKGETASEDVQVGILGWGVGCGENPEVSSRISDQIDWIRERVCEMSDFPCVPTLAPTATPSTSLPSSGPSAIPSPMSVTSTNHPSLTPSFIPSASPSLLGASLTPLPSLEPSPAPSALPSGGPSSAPSAMPSGMLSNAPTFSLLRNSEGVFTQDFRFASSSKMTLDQEDDFELVVNSLTQYYCLNSGDCDVTTSSHVENQEIIASDGGRRILRYSLPDTSTGDSKVGNRALNDIIRVIYSIKYQSRTVEVHEYPEEFVRYMSVRSNRNSFENKLRGVGINVLPGSASVVSTVSVGSTPAPSPISDEENSNTSVIVGVTVGALALLAVFGALCFHRWHQSKLRDENRQSAEEEGQAPTMAVEGTAVPVAVAVSDAEVAVGESQIFAAESSNSGRARELSHSEVGGRDAGFLPDASPSERRMRASELDRLKHHATEEGEDDDLSRKKGLGRKKKAMDALKTIAKEDSPAAELAGP